MTKREICERLMEIRDQTYKGHLGPVGIIDALRDLLLDLAAPVEEEDRKLEREEPEETHKHEEPNSKEATK